MAAICLGFTDWNPLNEIINKGITGLITRSGGVLVNNITTLGDINPIMKSDREHLSAGCSSFAVFQLGIIADQKNSIAIH